MPRSIVSISLLMALLASVLFAGLNPALAASSAQTSPTPPDPGDPAQVQAFIDGVMAARMETNHIAGAVVTVVKDGQLLFSKGYGYADLASHTPVDPGHTLFRPGSVSKLFIWTAVMQLVEQGKLDLDADINTYLDFKIPATYPQPITLKNLLDHTPGFEDQGDGLFKIRPEAVSSLDVYLKTHIPARVYPPGKLSAYSNYGAALASYIIERVSGMSFAEYAEKNIFTPLGMTHTTFRQPLPANLAPDMAQGYHFIQGKYVQGEFEYVVAYPVGGLSSTGTDMAKFMIAHLQNGRYGEGRILSESTAQQMHSQLFTPDQRMTGMAYGFFESKVNGQRILSHGGDTILFHSGLFLLPDQNTGIFISTNTASGGIACNTLANSYIEHFLPVPPAAQPTPAPDFATRLAPYVGEYHSARNNYTTFEKVMRLFQPTTVSLDPQGYLIINIPGQTIQAVEVAPGLLQDRYHPNFQLALYTDENGQRYLLPSTPFAFIKTPWYGTLTFNALLLVGGLLLFLGALIGWLLSFLSGLGKRSAHRQPRPPLARLARLAGALFGLDLIFSISLLLALFTTSNPAFGVPVIYFEPSPLMGILPVVTLLLTILGILMLGFTLLAWVKRYWGWGGRIYYTLLTLSALSLVWATAYWNLLG